MRRKGLGQWGGSSQCRSQTRWWVKQEGKAVISTAKFALPCKWEVEQETHLNILKEDLRTQVSGGRGEQNRFGRREPGSVHGVAFFPSSMAAEENLIDAGEHPCGLAFFCGWMKMESLWDELRAVQNRAIVHLGRHQTACRLTQKNLSFNW